MIVEGVADPIPMGRQPSDPAVADKHEERRRRWNVGVLVPKAAWAVPRSRLDVMVARENFIMFCCCCCCNDCR
jgi:hypothetical protein